MQLLRRITFYIHDTICMKTRVQRACCFPWSWSSRNNGASSTSQHYSPIARILSISAHWSAAAAAAAAASSVISSNVSKRLSNSLSVKSKTSCVFWPSCVELTSASTSNSCVVLWILSFKARSLVSVSSRTFWNLLIRVQNSSSEMTVGYDSCSEPCGGECTGNDSELGIWGGPSEKSGAGNWGSPNENSEAGEGESLNETSVLEPCDFFSFMFSKSCPFLSFSLFAEDDMLTVGVIAHDAWICCSSPKERCQSMLQGEHFGAMADNLRQRGGYAVRWTGGCRFAQTRVAWAWGENFTLQLVAMRCRGRIVGESPPCVQCRYIYKRRWDTRWFLFRMMWAVMVCELLKLIQITSTTCKLRNRVDADVIGWRCGPIRCDWLKVWTYRSDPGAERSPCAYWIGSGWTYPTSFTIREYSKLMRCWTARDIDVLYWTLISESCNLQ